MQMQQLLTNRNEFIDRALSETKKTPVIKQNEL